MDGADLLAGEVLESLDVRVELVIVLELIPTILLVVAHEGVDDRLSDVGHFLDLTLK